MIEGLTVAQGLVWFCALLLGGFIKGATGFGLPLIALPLLSLMWPVPTAIVTLVIPIFVSNIFLVAREGIGSIDARRFSSLVVFLVIGIFIGAWFLSAANDQLVYRVLGSIIVMLAIVNLTRPRLEVPTDRQNLFNPAVGFASGVIGGMSTLMAPVLIPYLASLRLSPSSFVATTAFIYLIGVTFVSIALASFDIVSYADFSLSVAAVAPVFIGLWIGSKFRDRLTVDKFLVAVDVLLVFMGVSLFFKVP